MAHDLETGTSYPETGYGYTKFMIPCYGRVYSDAPFVQCLDSLGPAKFWLRQGTVTTPIDEEGWRQPLPYYARYIESDCIPWNSMASDGCNWLTEPIQGHPNALFRYTPAGAKTPLFRNLGLNAANLRNWSKTRALANLNRSDLMLAVTFAERKKTYKMVLHAIRELKWFFYALKRGRFVALVKRFGKIDPFSLWLQWRYGWSQIYRDIIAMIDLIEDIEDGSYGRLRWWCKDMTKVAYKGDFETQPAMNGKVIFNRFCTGQESCYTRYDWNVKTLEYVWFGALGSHPLPTIYELIPFSFVTDWFFNLGTFLEAWAYQDGYAYKGGSQTVVGKYRENGSFTPGTWKECSIANMTNQLFDFHRYVEGEPSPAIALNPEILIGKMSPTRIFDAVSLLMRQHASVWKI